MVMEFKACHDWCFRLTLIFFFSFISSPICCVCLGYLYMFSSCWLFLLLFFLYHIIIFIIFIVIINSILNGEAAKAWNRSYSCRYHSSLHIDSYKTLEIMYWIAFSGTLIIAELLELKWLIAFPLFRCQPQDISPYKQFLI